MSGVLEVGMNEARTEVIVNHPDLKPDENGVGHIIFSPGQARQFAALLIKKAGECDGIFQLQQPTLNGWTAAQWESAWNDLLVLHMTTGSPAQQVPRTSEEALKMMLRWRTEGAPPDRTDPLVMSERMFDLIREDFERRGLLTARTS